MLKIKKDTSAKISLALAVTALLCLAAVLVALPFVAKRYDTYWGSFYIPALISLYCAAVPVGLADVLLILLLKRVMHGAVFSAYSVACLRGISWCCFAESIILLAAGAFVFLRVLPLVCLAAFAAAFLGIVLRVVKNVIEEATAIKSENDFTI